MMPWRSRSGLAWGRRLLGAGVALILAGPAARALAEDPETSGARAGPAATRTFGQAEDAGAERRLRDADHRKYARYDESDLQRARRTVGAMQRADPRLKRLFEGSAGYAVFAQMGTLGGSDGVGVLFEEGQAAGMATFPLAPVSLLSSDLPYAEVVLFGTRQAVANFKQHGLERAAQARAVAIVPGTRASIRFVDGVSVIVLGSGVTEPRSGRRAFEYLPYHREITARAQ